jgi:hypothetical protein
MDLSMGTNEELHADPVFEIPDLLAQRWLGDPQPQRGASEMQLLSHGNNISKNPQFHVWIHGHFQ